MIGGINVSVIAPSRYLRRFVSQDPPTIHYLAAQHVLEDAHYREFYREQAERGAHVIVDNGVFDLGHALDTPELARAAVLVRASELVLPDVIHDGEQTVAESDKAASALGSRTNSLRLCVVVQGAGSDDWKRCYDHFLAQSYVSAVALPSPQRRSSTPSVAFDRLAAVQYLSQNHLVRPGLTYRLLGLGDSGHRELAIMRSFTWIRSVDCASPVVLGALSREILPGIAYRKPPTKVEDLGVIPAGRFDLIHRNIRAIRSAAGCKIAVPAES